MRDEQIRVLITPLCIPAGSMGSCRPARLTNNLLMDLTENLKCLLTRRCH